MGGASRMYHRLFKYQRNKTDCPRELYPRKKCAVDKLQCNSNARVFYRKLYRMHSADKLHENLPFSPFTFPCYFPTNSKALLFREIELRYSHKGLFLSSALTRHPPLESSRGGGTIDLRGFRCRELFTQRGFRVHY